MKLIILLLSSFTVFGQYASPTYNPFNNRGIPYYGQGQIRPQGGYYQQFPNNNFQFPNNTNHPLNFHRPSYGFQNNFQRPQQQWPQQQWQQRWPQQQRPQIQPPQVQPPQVQPQQPQQQGNNQQQPQLQTRTFHLNNGYLYGQRTLYFDPKTGRNQPWVRRNLR